ncbi:chaperone protein dnaJ 15 isoform X1 [Arachis duranensis]|uniref:Chaperone protein dnaJ 15 isoform X1 n=1 Tax=Arachis duranensis TaxID=130453 RepID=A0A9C6WSF6_ARADU|nr:chaperone protein dnaJ 15 isoform X1 [Arachis duranensis]
MVQLAMAKDPKRTFFKRLEGLQPCEVSELKAGTHIFAVYGLNNLFLLYHSLLSRAIFVTQKYINTNSTCYHLGDNFFKTASYTIKAVCAKSYEDTTQKLKNIEAQIALARYQEVTERYAKEKQFAWCVGK